MTKPYQESHYPECKYGGFTDIDGTVAFYNRINALLDPSFVVLDVGCGRGSAVDDSVPYRRNLQVLKEKCAKVIGIDVDPFGSENQLIDEFRLIEDESWPIDDNSINMIVCNSVLEHVSNPMQIFSEFSRTIVPGGYLCIRTPNRWAYPAIVATLIPNRHHAALTSKVQNNRQAKDVFPTLYRCNRIDKIKQLLTSHGFESAVYGYEAEPSYLSFSRFAYFLGVLHQRYAPRVMKPAIFAFAVYIGK